MNCNFIYCDYLLKKINKYSLKRPYTLEQFKLIRVFQLPKGLYCDDRFDNDDTFDVSIFDEDKLTNQNKIDEFNLYKYNIASLNEIFYQPIEREIKRVKRGYKLIGYEPTDFEMELYKTYPEYLYFLIPEINLYIKYHKTTFMDIHFVMTTFIINNKKITDWFGFMCENYINNINICCISNYKDITKNNIIYRTENDGTKKKYYQNMQRYLYNFYNYGCKENININIQYSMNPIEEKTLCGSEIDFIYLQKNNKLYISKKFHWCYCIEDIFEDKRYFKHLTNFKLFIFFIYN